MFRDLDEALCHEESGSKYPPVVVSGYRVGGRYGSRIFTATNPASGAAIEVTDMSNEDDDILTTVYARQHAERVGAGAGCKAQDIVGVRNFGLSYSPSSLLVFHALKKVRLKEKSCGNEWSHCRRLWRRK